MTDQKSVVETANREGGAFAIRAADGPWSTVQLGDRFSKGLYVTGSVQQIFMLSVSLACIDVLRQDVARTPIELRRRVDGGDELVRPGEHPVADILDNPSEYYGRREFMNMLTAHIAVSNEYFVAVMRDNRGNPLEMQGIPKSRADVSVNPEERKYVYYFHPSTMHEQAQFGWTRGGMLGRDVAHIRHRTMNGIDALSTTSLMRSTLELLKGMQEFQTNIFDNGGMPVMALAFPEAMTDEQWERLNKGLARAHQKARDEKTPFILEGADGEVPTVHKMSMSAVDTEFVKANAAAGLEACRYFRVPPHKVNLLETIKYDNLSAQERRYVDEALCPIFEVTEESLGRVLLSGEDRKKYFLRFDREKAYTSDPEIRQKIVESRWKHGMIEYDEMRRAIGQNAVGGNAGRYRMFSGNFVIVDENGEVIMRAGGNTPNDQNQTDPNGNSSGSKAAHRLQVVK